MEACYQFEKQSVAEHGRAVAYHYFDLLSHLQEQKPLRYDWKLPEWVRSPEIQSRLLPYYTTMVYLIYHDCGKPYCRTVDEDGKQHFPNHAKVSQEVFDHLVSLGHKFSEDDALVSRLIGEDMDVHLLKDEGVAEFAARPEAATQLLAGLAELTSNAVMFGGLESIGFKSKWKNLDRRGKAIVKLWKEQSHV